MLLDIFGALTSLLSTWYFIRFDKKAWLISMLASIFNVTLYWRKGIYADMLLESFYFLSSGYGFLLWKEDKKEAQKFDISFLTLRQSCTLLMVTTVSYLVIKNLLISYTNSTVATLDALTAALGILGQCLMCYKIISTWLLWLISDAIYACLYYQKAIPFHSLLMLFYTGMAMAGYWTWYRQVIDVNHPFRATDHHVEKNAASSSVVN